MTIPQNQAQITVGLKLTSSLITAPPHAQWHRTPPQTHPRKKVLYKQRSYIMFLFRAASCLDEFTAQESQKPDNQDKNRYPNIIAFDHTRWPPVWNYEHFQRYPNIIAFFDHTIQNVQYHTPLSQSCILNAGSDYEEWDPERQRQRRRTNTWMPTMWTDSEGAEPISPPRDQWPAPLSFSGGW